MGNRRRHIGSSLAALTLTLSLLTGLLTGCGPGGSQSSSPEAGSTPPAASQSTQTPEQPALPELTTDTYGNAAVGYQAAVVSANEYTSRIGMDILEAGGNAVDAAVAMIFANSLTEPGATSLGGASFMTINLKETGEYICIEAMETAPAAAGIDTLDEINEKKGAMLVTVPGQVHGALTALEKYGTMTREEVLAPVIQLAEEGFDVHISFEERASASFDKLVQNEEAAKILEECGYGDLSGLSAKDAGAALEAHIAALFDEVEGMVPEGQLVQLFRLKYDYHNAKALVKGAAVGADADRLLMEGGRWSAAQVKEAFQRDSLREFTGPFRRAVVQARETLNGGNDPQLADFVLDRAYFAEMAETARAVGSPFLEGYVRLRRRQPALRRPVRPDGEGERLFEPGAPARGKCGGPRAHVRQGQ